jgi:hypothetical protein
MGLLFGTAGITLLMIVAKVSDRLRRIAGRPGDR